MWVVGQLWATGHTRVSGIIPGHDPETQRWQAGTHHLEKTGDSLHNSAPNVSAYVTV